MSIDLDWPKLDSSLADSLVELLNRQLASTARPSFIGPVEVTSLDFGSAAPDIELVDLRDIYRDFREDDEDETSNPDPVKVAGYDDEEDDGFEWVSRRAAASGRDPPMPRYGRGTGELFAGHGYPSAQRFSMSQPSLVDFGPASPRSLYRAPGPPPTPSPPPTPAPPPQGEHPDLQLHFRITWRADLRLVLTTSLLINYPSPLFMALPIRLAVTGLLFTGELAVAYEGARRRIHLCVLDDLDPYGPALARRDTPPEPPSAETPPDADDDGPAAHSGVLPPRAKPLPVGQRLLPVIEIESEIGQADKHVLKNVTRVERFIQDVIRKTVEEELVFPNFHTLVMGDPA